MSRPCRSLVCGLALLSVTGTVGWQHPARSRVPLPSLHAAARQLPSLTAQYAALLATTAELARKGTWPDATARGKLQRGLHRTAGGLLETNSFNDGHGPLQACFFLASDPAWLDLAADATRHVFEPFVRELESGLHQDHAAVVRHGLLWPCPSTLHLAVRVFSEHPSLLDPDQAAHWSPVSASQVAALDAAISARVQSGALAATVLRLWGPAITPDGSMLLLFEEDADDDARTLLATRHQLTEIGEQALAGGLNSRPKAFVHVTCGRILDWPDGSLNAGEQAHVARVVAKWFEAERPTMPQQGGAFAVRELALVRDLKWTMQKHERVATYVLQEQPPRCAR